MQPQLYRNVEHPGLGLLEVVEATPIEGDLRQFLPSNFGHEADFTHRSSAEIDYNALTQKRSGLYDVRVRDTQGLKFTLKNAF